MVKIVANLDLPGDLSLSLTARGTQPARDLRTQVGISSLEELRAELCSRGIVFALTHVRPDLLHDLGTFGLADAIGHDRLFPTLRSTADAFDDWTDEQQPPKADNHR